MPAKRLDKTVCYEALRAVGACGSVSAAAASLGVHRTTLAYRVSSAKLFGAEVAHGGVVLHIPDLHCPFMHQDAVEFIRACIDRHNPTDIVLAGDELDQHALSDYAPDPNGYSAGHEREAGLEQIAPLYSLIPEAKICVSNHGARPFRKAYKAGIPAAYLKTYAQFMNAPRGWVWADEFVIDGVRYTHGEEATGTGGAVNLATRRGQSQAVGHWHGDAGPVFFNSGTRTVFGLYSGCLIDEKAYAFAYGKTAKKKPILGASIIRMGVPFFQPMVLGAGGRWVGGL